MKNWREYINQGDIKRAAEIAGCNRENYRLSKKLPPAEWTSPMVAINRELKRIVVEREQARFEFIKEDQAC